MGETVCCVDLGTSRIKGALIDPKGALVAHSSCPAPPPKLSGGGVELDAEATFEATCRCVAEVVGGGAGAEVVGVALTGQRATVVPVAPGGRAAGPALSWQDTRGQEQLDRLRRVLPPADMVAITGLPPSTLWSLSKILWLRERSTGAAAEPMQYTLLADYVLSRLGAGELVTDPSNASLTSLLDLKRLDWSPEVLAAAGIDASMLPRIEPSGAEVGALDGEVARRTGLAQGTPLVLGGGDQQCAALGLAVCDPGDVGLCVGTAAVVSCPTDRPSFDQGGGWFCTAHVIPDRWVVEGIHNSFGSSLTWARELLGLDRPEDLPALARESSEGAGGVTYLPFLAGIGSPDFDPAVRGGLEGLDLSTTRAEVARAVLEGVSLEVRRILDALETGARPRRLELAGGATDRYYGQVLADVLGLPLGVSSTPEASLLGAAILAWTAAGRYESPAQGARSVAARGSREIVPGPSRDWVARGYQRYLKLVRKKLGALS